MFKTTPSSRNSTSWFGHTVPMSTLEELIRSGSPGTPIQFRPQPYGSDGEAEFLRDLLAMSNANVKGPRLILVGVDSDATGAARVTGVSEADFKIPYEAIARRHIESPVQLTYRPVGHDNKQIGIFQIANCQDRPYMMRGDHSATLHHGDAWVRINNQRFRLGRSQLQALFQANSKDSIGTEQVEIGFAGVAGNQPLILPVCDLKQLPSAVAANKIRSLITTKANSSGSGNTTMMLRLTHAKAFGSNDPYKDQSVEELTAKLDEITQHHQVDDQNFMFEANGSDLQLRVFNQADTAIEDGTLTLTIPKVEGLLIAQRPDDPGYPAIDIKADFTLVTVRLGEIPPGAPTLVFKSPIKLCVSGALKGQRLNLGYTLFGRNLRSPVGGQLPIDFQDQLQALMG
jgi:hypothetical protein